MVNFLTGQSMGAGSRMLDFDMEDEEDFGPTSGDDTALVALDGGTDAGVVAEREEKKLDSTFKSEPLARQVDNFFQQRADYFVPAYNSKALLGDREYTVVELSPAQIAAIVKLHDKCFPKSLYNAGSTYDARSLKELMADNPDDDWRHIEALRERVTAVLAKFPDGAFFRSHDASGKDVMTALHHEGEKIEAAIWKKYAKFGGKKEELAEHFMHVCSLFDDLRNSAQIFGETLKYLEMSKVQKALDKMQVKAHCGLLRAAVGGLIRDSKRKQNLAKLLNMYESYILVIHAIDEIEKKADFLLKEQFQTFLRKLIDQMKQLQLLEIANLQQLDHSLEAILQADPVNAFPPDLRPQINKFLDKLGFSRKNFDEGRKHLQYFVKHPDQAAVLGAIESELDAYVKKGQKVQTADDVLLIALKSERIYLNALSCLEHSHELGFCFAKFVKLDGDEFRCFSDGREVMAISSYAGDRSRAMSMPLPEGHPYVAMITKAVKDFFNTKAETDGKTPSGDATTLADHAMPRRWYKRFFERTFKSETGVLKTLDHYTGFSSEMDVLDVHIESDILSKTVHGTRFMEKNPGTKIADANGFLWDELERLKQLTGQPRQVVTRLTDYNLGANYAKAKEGRRKAIEKQVHNKLIELDHASGMQASNLSSETIGELLKLSKHHYKHAFKLDELKSLLAGQEADLKEEGEEKAGGTRSAGIGAQAKTPDLVGCDKIVTVMFKDIVAISEAMQKEDEAQLERLLEMRAVCTGLIPAEPISTLVPPHKGGAIVTASLSRSLVLVPGAFHVSDQKALPAPAGELPSDQLRKLLAYEDPFVKYVIQRLEILYLAMQAMDRADLGEVQRLQSHLKLIDVKDFRKRCIQKEVERLEAAECLINLTAYAQALAEVEALKDTSVTQ